MGKLNTNMIWFIFGAVILYQPFLNAEIILTKVDRTIDLTSQLTKITSQISIENKGGSPIRDFVLAIEEEVASHISFLDVSVRILYFVIRHIIVIVKLGIL